MKKKKRIEQPLFVYRYRILSGKYAKVEAELNKLAVANPLGVNVLRMEDYICNYEMTLVLKICKLNKRKGEFETA